MKKIVNFFKEKNLFNNKKDNEKRDGVNVNDWKDIYNFANGYDLTPYEELKEATYFSCINLISESIAKRSLHLNKTTDKGKEHYIKHELYEKLRLRPNKYMSALDCYKAFVSLAKHYGIAGLYINRHRNGEIEGLYPAKIEQVTIDDIGFLENKDETNVLYSFTLAGTSVQYDVFGYDLIILRNFSMDGIKGKATRSIIKENLDSSMKTQNYLNKLFANGLTSKLAVQISSQVKDEKELKKIQEKFNRIYSNNGRIFTIPSGYQVQPLNLSLADAQFADLRKLTKEEIAMSFNVPLSKLGFVSSTTINHEEEDLKFNADCLEVIFLAIEQEMNWKLLSKRERKKGLRIEFNTNSTMRIAALKQSEIISTYVKNGIYDLDTARGMLGVKKLGGEPVITLPSGQVLLSDLLEGNVSYVNKNNNKNNNEGDNNGDS